MEVAGECIIPFTRTPIENIGYTQVVKPIKWLYHVSVLRSFKNEFMIRRLRKKYNHYFAGYEYNNAKKQLL